MKFNIGDIVAIKNHFSISSKNKIFIKGNPDLIPPTMVVIETLIRIEENKQLLEQVKCVYYSHKHNKYLNSWFKVEQLKLIMEHVEGENHFIDPPKLETEDIVLNQLVILKNVDIELGKIKASYNTNSSDTPKQIFTSLLSFLPPAMIVIGVSEKEEKNLSNSQKSIRKRNFSKKLFKCKWYNPYSNSFSEEYISPYALEKIVYPNEDILIQIQNIIKNKKYIKLNDRIILPINLFFNHYKYEIEYFDYKDNETKQKNVFEILNMIKKDELNEIETDSYIKQSANKKLETSPIFYRDDNSFYSVEEFIDKHKNEGNFGKNFYRIKYMDKFNNITNRTITDCQFFINDDNLSNEKIEYIIANCKLRKAERMFRAKGILKIEQLDF